MTRFRPPGLAPEIRGKPSLRAADQGLECVKTASRSMPRSSWLKDSARARFALLTSLDVWDGIPSEDGMNVLGAIKQPNVTDSMYINAGLCLVALRET